MEGKNILKILWILVMSVPRWVPAVCVRDRFRAGLDIWEKRAVPGIARRHLTFDAA